MGNKKTFRKELRSNFIMIGVIPFIICCLFMIELFQIQAARELDANSIKLLSEMSGRYERMIGGYESLASRVEVSAVIRRFLKAEKENSADAVYREIYAITSSFRDYAWFEIYDSAGVRRYTTGNDDLRSDLPPYWGMFRMATEDQRSLIIKQGGTFAEPTGASLCFCRALYDDDGIYGFFVINMGDEELATLFKETYGGQDGLLLLDQNMRTVYAAGIATDNSMKDLARERYISGEPLTKEFRDNRVIIYPTAENFQLYLIRPNVFSETTIIGMYRVLLGMVILIIVLCVIMSAQMSTRLSSPINAMTEAMQKIRHGNLDVRMSTDWNNEFAELAKTFNKMTDDIDSYTKLQVQQQKELNNAQIGMMRAQLNPHFLYNTLDTIKWVAKANHVPEIATLVSKLAKILRASISKEQFTSLRSELELVDSYAEIQKIRFNGRFECVCICPVVLEEVIVPKLIVQPIVENAVIHGLKDMANGHIRVEAFTDDNNDKLYISVTDDGSGISDEDLRKLTEPRHDEEKGHIGLKNVESIIRLNYGEEYGIKVNRQESGGTKVTMSFPMNYRKADEGE